MSSAADKHARARKVNRIGVEKESYRGAPSTLCPGCGHDSITSRIVDSMWELGIDPTQVMKFSGIGCSSKSPAYFMRQSHGFNGVHGRMPTIATGAVVANRGLVALGVSGDGDTGSIGIGQFKHLIRRNVPMVYIIENNGVYGLTKGQFSVTADPGQSNKYAGGVNEYPTLDPCIEALAAECTFVARCFAGDAKQVREVLQAALHHRGTALVDIISPCVTFNNREDSTKSFPWGRHHQDPIADYSFIPDYEEIEEEIDDEGVTSVRMHDGSVLRIKKIDREYDPTSRDQALLLLEKAKQEQLLLTGIFYVSEDRPSLVEYENLPERPLIDFTVEELRPAKERLEAIMDDLMRKPPA
jgi:2-oxoglutarate ferredoxin oxidoreductase subunit beta